MQGKRGLSGVITTLIIILLVIAAIGIIWAVVNPFIRESAEEISLAKFTLDLRIKNAYMDGDNVVVRVQRGAGDGDLVGLQFIISDGLNSITVEKDSTLAQQEMETYTLTGIEWGVVVPSEVTEVSVAPIYATTSGTAVKGNIADTYVIGVGNVGSTGGTTPPVNPGCTATWTCESLGYTECGTPNDNCGNALSCGVCTGNNVCNGTGQCVAPEQCLDTCESLGYECNYNSANWTICGESTDCGSCAGGSICNSTGQCESGFVDGGIINSIWPPAIGMYFDSENLTKDEPTCSLYVTASYFIRFPGSSESECLRIIECTLPKYPERYNMTLLRLGAFQTDIANGENYEIFVNVNTCMNSP